MEPYSFIRAFEPGIRARTRHYGLAIIWCRTVGELVVTSGKIVARDPGYFKGVTHSLKRYLLGAVRLSLLLPILNVLPTSA
jgi:hypothetical protein